MSKILVSGLVNTETTVKVKGFPIAYFPIDYPFFGVQTQVAGVAYNIAKALGSLSDEVTIYSMTGQDFGGDYVQSELEKLQLSGSKLQTTLKQTPNTVVLYDAQGKRQIYCDLKDIQESSCTFSEEQMKESDLIVACNINFNRELLKKAAAAGKLIATDVHVLSDIQDDYNADFMKYANILFLSDEAIPGDYREFLLSIEQTYQTDIIVLGMGAEGALMYVKKEQCFYELPAVNTGKVVNTVGAGDALFAGFIHYYLKNLSPKEALLRAEIFASLKIQWDGASNGFADEGQVEKILESF